MSSNGGQHCPSCDSVLLKQAMETDRFLYGAGPNPVTLEAEVEVFTCTSCGEKWTGEQGEAARAASVAMRRLEVFPQMVLALKAQHEAIDTMFAMLIAKTLHHEKPFYPSESGRLWEACLAGKAAIEAAGGVPEAAVVLVLVEEGDGDEAKPS